METRRTMIIRDISGMMMMIIIIVIMIIMIMIIIIMIIIIRIIIMIIIIYYDDYYWDIRGILVGIIWMGKFRMLVVMIIGMMLVGMI